MEIKIDEATRVAGHLGVTVRITDGKVSARVLQKEFRGFEILLKGRPAEEAPIYASRICGICQVPHSLASVEAVEDGLGIEVSPDVQALREVANLAGTIQSHLLHLFLLMAPEGLGAAPAPRGMDKSELTEIVRTIFAGRREAQMVIQLICGRKVHPVTIVPGGFSKAITPEDVRTLSDMTGRLLGATGDLGRRLLPIFEKESEARGVELKARCLCTDGSELVVMDGNGTELLRFDKRNYVIHIAEREAEQGYLRHPYLKDVGYPEGFCRVGPLARLNSSHAGGELWPGMKHQSVMYSYARVVESVRASERMRALLDTMRDGVKSSPAPLKFKAGEGVGVIEAPRGTLIHNYSFGSDGLITRANIITPTAFNSPAMERDIEQNVVNMSEREAEDIRLRALQVVRDYDPCIPCATHLIEVRVD